ncbi:MAG: putative lipopolysaccharide heptosyltransferase III [Verrucomicrobiaceae bacterium]|nr:putative lipopolysaccharide heptosyltransferase III [Verrucomicrobiaceae bacterium]
MKVLLIKLKNIGDTLLLTPTILGIKQRYPHAHIAVLVRSGTESILLGCPELDEVLLSASPEKQKRSQALLGDLKTLRHIRAQQYDFVFELTDNDRGRWIAMFSKANCRVASAYGRPVPWYFKHGFTDFSTTNWHMMHRVEKDYRLVSEFLPLPEQISPLAFDPPSGYDPLVTEEQSYIIIHPVTRWRRKSWPTESWVKVGRYLISLGYRCIISSGPDEYEIGLADEITQALGDKAVSTRGQRSWGELARLMRGARLFVGLDTAAMHLAAACQCPIVALFGPSIEHHWSPWKTPHEIVSPGGLLHYNYPDFIYDAEKRKMEDILAADVIAACDRMLAKRGGGA